MIMINDIHAEGTGSEAPRVVAIVAEEAERAREIAALFRSRGEAVDVRWYATPMALLAQYGRPRFEAVILFPEPGGATTEVDEARLRGHLSDTPVFHVA